MDTDATKHEEIAAGTEVDDERPPKATACGIGVAWRMNETMENRK